jgi:hypothetical protein
MSGSAPAWVSYAALGVSGIAAVIAGASARISYLSYRASGPRLQLVVQSLTRDPSSGRVLVRLKVVNRGRGDVDVAGFYVTPYGARKPVLEVKEVASGPGLPRRVAGSSEESWTLDLVPTAKRYVTGLRDRTIKPRSSWPEQAYLSVKGGNGKFVHAKSRQFSTRQLIIDSLPDANE